VEPQGPRQLRALTEPTRETEQLPNRQATQSFSPDVAGEFGWVRVSGARHKAKLTASSTLRRPISASIRLELSARGQLAADHWAPRGH